MEAVGLIVSADVVRLHPYFFRLDALYAQCQVQPFGEKKLGFGRIIHFFMPFFLIGQARTVVQSAFYRNRQIGRQGISQCDTYIAYVAHLLGYERAVGKILLVG